MEIQMLNNLQALEDHAAAWDELVQHTPHTLPMQSHAWLSCYFQHCLRPGETWFCLLAFQGKRLLGVLPLISSHRSGLRVLTGLGKRLRLPDDEQTTISVDVVLAVGHEREVLKCLAEHLQKLDGGWQELDMPRVPEHSSSLAALPVLRSQLYDLCEPRSVGSYLITDGDFSAYRAKLNSKFRGNLRNATNRLARLDNVEYEFLSEADATPQHVESFFEVEAASWKGDAGSAIIADANHRAFYQALTEALWRRGWLEWHFLKAEGRTIAAQLAIRCGATLLSVHFKIPAAMSSMQLHIFPGTITGTC